LCSLPSTWRHLGIAHSPQIEASIGWLVVFNGPDGIEHHLYTLTTHGADRCDRSDRSDRPGLGRPVLRNERHVRPVTVVR
jgi:hypothetical protein